MRALIAATSALGLLVALALGIIHLVVNHYARFLPDYRALTDYRPKVATRMYAADGELLADFATENRIFVPITSIPKLVKEAFIAAEDKDFYRHRGVDPEGILRAALTDVSHWRDRRRLVGGSTITQQVARDFLLTRKVTLDRKIREAILALRIEQVLSKDRILELYLNQIYLGRGSYGVAAAALTYFGKSLDALTLPEIAFLAALPKAPDRYYRAANHEAALTRRNYVIGRMLEDDYIDRAAAEAAMASPLNFRSNTIRPAGAPAAQFVEDARRRVLASYGADQLYGGGLTIRTTLAPRLQRIAIKAFRDGLVAYDERHGWRGPLAHFSTPSNWAEKLAHESLPPGAEGWRLAMVLSAGAAVARIGFDDGTIAALTSADVRWTGHDRVDQVVRSGDVVLVEAAGSNSSISGSERGTTTRPSRRFMLRQVPAANGALVALDPHTGRVLALVGGFSYASSEFDRATQALRQPGSAFKPFVYLAALDSGMTPSTIVLDAPIAFDQGRGLPAWRPRNYEHDFLGPLPLRRGLELSRNTIAVRVAAAIGIDKVAAYGRKFGIADDERPDLSMALGTSETTLLRLTTAYAEIDNGGRKITPTLIDRIQDRWGRTLFRHDTRRCDGCGNVAWANQPVPEIPDMRPQIQDPRTAYQLVEMLEGVVGRGTGRALAALGRPVAGKTGTTSDSKDLWFIGFTPNLAVGVYVGFDQPKSLGAYETGATAAAPIVRNFLAAALANRPAVPFRVPPGVRLARVDAYSGQPAAPDDPAAIWEAFLPGTEPGVGKPLPPDAQILAGDNLRAATTGTGGIY